MILVTAGVCVKLFADDTNLFVFSNDVVDLQIDTSEKNWYFSLTGSLPICLALA